MILAVGVRAVQEEDLFGQFRAKEGVVLIYLYNPRHKEQRNRPT